MQPNSYYQRLVLLLCTSLFIAIATMISSPTLPAKGNVASGVSVQIKTMEGKVLYELKTDENGAFSLTNLQPGVYAVHIKNSTSAAKKNKSYDLVLSSETSFFHTNFKPESVTKNAAQKSVYNWRLRVLPDMPLLFPPVIITAPKIDCKVTIAEK